ncbi:MAG: hemolysin D [Micavibrio sp.]|nr:MAG: hemolysin D [Micavibrio sp.]
MKSSKIIAVVIAVVALAWILSGVLFAGPEEKSAQKMAAKNNAQPKIMEVRVRELTAESFANDIIVTGRSRASRTVEIKAETDGQISELLKEKGHEVEDQETLARLELRDRSAKVKEGKQRLSQRQIEYNAAKKLANKGFNSKVRLAQAQADLETARSELKNSEVSLGKTKIISPFEGLIFEQVIEIGDFVSVGDPLFTVVDLDPIELVAFVSERNIAELSPGQKARAEFLDGQVIEGEVSYIAPAADPQTRTFRVEITGDNTDFTIKEGMTANMFLPVAEKQAHKISPSVLSLNDSGQVGVKIVNEKNEVVFAPVAILADTPEHMWVGGLPDKIRLITVGQDFVSGGQIVKPVEVSGDGLL